MWRQPAFLGCEDPLVGNSDNRSSAVPYVLRCAGVQVCRCAQFHKLTKTGDESGQKLQ